MSIPTDLSIYAQWAGILTLVCLVVAGLGFIFQWGIRFRLVGITGFMGVVTVGLFGLSLGLFSYTQVPGAAPFSVVYDNGANKAVIALPPKVNESEVEASLRKAAADLYSYGRLGRGDDKLTIRARAVTHPESGVSKPLYLGQVKRSLASREDENMKIEVFSERFAQLPETSNMN
ncbi:MAG: hypothetical protein BRC44_01695 [Cyanobacteria bacterium QS_4_48_99]|nr:MAG: hypothetical protein BRC44_01695 [Cyanobacteria bacterium QS_4_48_99]